MPKIIRKGERKEKAVPIKKEKKTEFTAPVLDLRMAQLQIIEGTLQEEPVEITAKSGETFTSKPNYNAKIEVVLRLKQPSISGSRISCARPL